jgi:hypothetical protein
MTGPSDGLRPAGGVGPVAREAAGRIAARARRLTVAEAESLSLYVRDERRRDEGLTSGPDMGWAEAARELDATCAALDQPDEGQALDRQVRALLREGLPRSLGNAARDDVILAAVRAAQAEALHDVLEGDVRYALARPWSRAVELGRPHRERPGASPPATNEPAWLDVILLPVRLLDLLVSVRGCMPLVTIACIAIAARVVVARPLPAAASRIRRVRGA